VGVCDADQIRIRLGRHPREPGGRGAFVGPELLDYAEQNHVFDAVIARYATRVNGITDYFITKLDVLSGLDKVPVCVAYDVDGIRHAEIPMTQTEFHHARPVYEYLDGWWEDISAAKELSDLPANARAYVKALEDMIGAPVAAVGTGPRRDQTLQIRPLT